MLRVRQKDRHTNRRSEPYRQTQTKHRHTDRHKQKTDIQTDTNKRQTYRQTQTKDRETDRHKQKRD